MAGICLAAGALHAFIATSGFTLAWMHSIEKIRWEEDYRVVAGKLVLEEARIRGTGAGMEPPPDAVLRSGVYHYHPHVSPLASLSLARSAYTRDFELCVPGHPCRPLSKWIPVSAGTTRVAPCEGARPGR